MNTRFRKRTFALRGIICIWLFTGIVSILKTLFMYINDIAIPFRLCISLIDPAHISSFSNMLVWVLFFYYFTVSLSMLFMHLKLCMSLKITERNLNISNKQRKSNAQIWMQIIVITLSCLLSWLPSNIVFSVVSFKEKYPMELIIWIIVSVMPINSLVSPVTVIVTNFKKAFLQEYKINYK